MKNLKKILMTALCSVCLLLSGCIRIGVDVELRSNGTAAAALMYGMSSDYCTEEDFKDSDHEVQRFTIDGKEYIGYKEEQTYKSYKDLCADLLTYEEEGSALFTSCTAVKKKGLIKNTYTFDAVMPAFSESSESSALMDSMILINFNLKMPGSIDSCSGGTINEDGSITFKVDTDKECSFSAKSSEVNVLSIILIVIIAIVVAAAAVTAAGKKKSVY